MRVGGVIGKRQRSGGPNHAGERHGAASAQAVQDACGHQDSAVLVRWKTRVQEGPSADPGCWEHHLGKSSRWESLTPARIPHRTETSRVGIFDIAEGMGDAWALQEMISSGKPPAALFMISQLSALHPVPHEQWQGFMRHCKFLALLHKLVSRVCETQQGICRVWLRVPGVWVRGWGNTNSLLLVCWRGPRQGGNPDPIISCSAR